jgi:enterochelin esterase family protein
MTQLQPSRGLLFTGLCLLMSTCACSSSDSGPDGSDGTSPAGNGSASAGKPGNAGGIGLGGAGAESSTGGASPGSAGSDLASNGGTAGAKAAAGAAGASAGPGSAGTHTAGAAGAAGTLGNAGKPGSTDPGTEGDGDIVVGPTYSASPDGNLKAGAPAGFSVTFDLGSAVSKIFTGADYNLSFKRQIRVWVPSQYIDGTEAPFMVSSDGFYGGLQTVVQNLADDPDPTHRVPPLVIIGIQNGPNNSPSERSLEYDTVSDRYSKFVNEEVLALATSNAALRAKYPNFKLTSDPNGRGGYGCSSGGPAVMGLAWFGGFNRVFSFSGSFVALRPNTEHPLGAWEYPSMIAAAPLRPDLRVFLEIGESDNGAGSAESTHRNWPMANKNFAAALKAKGNHYRYVFAKGAGHCDDDARSQVMPEGLIWLWRGYTAP